MAFPPNIVYPLDIDSDETLYAVYNTSESALAVDNTAWNEEIEIVPVGLGKNEIWADNGFINIAGELIYYGLVDKDANGKVFKFKRCLRNFGGTDTHFNPAGTPVRGFVVAEHHNQLVNAILSMEGFFGENFSEDTETLDWRIRNLQGTTPIFDDHGCPDVTLIVTTVESDPASGTLISYEIDISGTVEDFTLQFGDGSFTKSTQPGEHRYAPNVTIDPVIFASNGDCEIIQTPLERSVLNDPQITTPPDVFEIPLQNIPGFPNININISPTEFDMPIIPINFPCIEFGGISGTIPSSISIVFGDGVSFPSSISIEVPEFPDINVNVPEFPDIDIAVPEFPTISFSPITFPTVQFDEPFFPLVQFAPVIFPMVQFAVPDFPQITFGTPPTVSVNWGTPPTLSCNCSITCPSAASMTMKAWAEEYGYNNQDFDLDEIPVEYNIAGIPDEIRIVAADIPPAIKLEHNIPSSIKLDFEIPKIPTISLEFANSLIELVVPSYTKIGLDVSNLPSSILLDGSNIPSNIELIAPNVPSSIMLDASNVPSSINLTGVPSSIKLEHNIPDVIKLLMPDNPVIEIAPISVVVKLDMQKITNENGEEMQCVAIVPCSR